MIRHVDFSHHIRWPGPTALGTQCMRSDKAWLITQHMPLLFCFKVGQAFCTFPLLFWLKGSKQTLISREKRYLVIKGSHSNLCLQWFSNCGTQDSSISSNSSQGASSEGRLQASASSWALGQAGWEAAELDVCAHPNCWRWPWRFRCGQVWPLLSYPLHAIY